MKIEKKLITPSIAKALLEANKKNRTINKKTVDRYAKDIKNNVWREDTAEFIKISKTNIILDGQHRLLAVVKADNSAYFHIAMDLEDSIFDILDTGKSRNAIDVFKIEGVKNETVVPHIIMRYLHFKHSSVRLDRRGLTNLTNSELLEVYKEKQNHWQMVTKKALAWYKQFARLLAPSYFGGFYALFYDINAKDADEFMEQLATGNDIKNNSIKLLRTKLINDRLSLKKIPVEVKCAFVIKAWNLYRQDQNSKILKWTPETEQFPEPI